MTQEHKLTRGEVKAADLVLRAHALKMSATSEKLAAAVRMMRWCRKRLDIERAWAKVGKLNYLTEAEQDLQNAIDAYLVAYDEETKNIAAGN
jgi:hypothetical protein